MTWSPPPLHALPSWAEAKRVAIDIETRDPWLTTLGPGVRRPDSYITGVSFALDSGFAAYMPIRHEGGQNYCDPHTLFAYLREQAKVFRGDLVGANMQYDLDWLMEEGVVFTPRFFRDIQNSGPLLHVPSMNPNENKMSLNAQAARCGIPGKDEAPLEAWATERGLNTKKDMWRMPAEVVAPYAIQDVKLPLQIIARHERQIDEQELWTVYDLESRLLPVLVKMRRRGVRVNLSKLGEIAEVAARKEREAMREATTLCGVTLTDADTMSAARLAPALEAAGIAVPSTPTGKPSVKAGWLAAREHPVAKQIQEARRWNKIRTTFCGSIEKHAIQHGDEHRIHCTFNQLRQERETGDTKGAEFGRLSSSDPNLQQQPARDPEIGPLWRSIYLPDQGGQWACLDFSSQEPRWITHYAEATGVPGGKEAAEQCRTDPKWDNHSMTAGLMFSEFCRDAYDAGDKGMKDIRGAAKIIFLGRCYGMGGGKLCKSLGLPTVVVWKDWANDGKGGNVEMAGPEGQALIDQFDSRVGYVKALADLCKWKAQRVGYIRTILGRRCHFPRGRNGGVMWVHKALNRLIQGTSADQTKLVMVMADEVGIPLQLQVHDELDLTIHDPKEADALAHIMRNAVPCNVPTVVDIETGPSWGEIK